MNGNESGTWQDDDEHFFFKLNWVLRINKEVFLERFDFFYIL